MLLQAAGLPPDADRPIEDGLFERRPRDAGLHAGVHLFVHPRHADYQHGADLTHVLRQRVDTLREGGGPAHVEAEEGLEAGKRMRQGKEEQVDVTFPQIRNGAAAFHHEHVVAVRLHHPLGRPGGARCVHVGGLVIRRQPRQALFESRFLVIGVAASPDQVGEHQNRLVGSRRLVRHHDDVFQGRDLIANGQNLVELCGRVDEHRRGAGVLQDVGRLIGR